MSIYTDKERALDVADEKWETSIANDLNAAFVKLRDDRRELRYALQHIYKLADEAGCGCEYINSPSVTECVACRIKDTVTDVIKVAE